jgi:hypothetical protein
MERSAGRGLFQGFILYQTFATRQGLRGCGAWRKTYQFAKTEIGRSESFRAVISLAQSANALPARQFDVLNKYFDEQEGQA